MIDHSSFIIAARLLRICFGLSLVLIGFAFYLNFAVFQGMVSEDLGFLSLFGTIWAYILPGLMIIGGGLLMSGMYMEMASWIAGMALSSLPVGLLLKCVVSGIPVHSIMVTVDEALLWLFIFCFVVKSSGECDSYATEERKISDYTKDDLSLN
ncbi:MAG: hypothetical protein WCG83_03075 [Candidatus Peregrinibacteria bacterium]